MQRRTIAILLIAAGFIALIGILVWLFWPKATQKPLPPPLPGAATPSTGGQTGTPQKPPVVQPGIKPVPPSEQQTQDALKRQALDFTARVATYSSVDGFASMQQVYTEANTAVQTYLEGERAKLIAAHPASGTSWSQTTRAIATRLVTAPPIMGKTNVEMVVQVQQYTRTGSDAPTSPTYQEADIQFTRVNDAWIVSHFQWQPYQP